MSCETFTCEMDGNKYAYTQLSARDSLLLKFKLSAIIGNVAGKISTAIGSDKENQTEIFCSSLSKIFSENKPEDILSLIEYIFIPVFINGERIDIDKHYQGNFGEMYRVLFWVLKCEYGYFFEEVQSLV